MSIDLAMCDGKDGKVELHTATCPKVRFKAEVTREPVFTMIGCQGLVPETADLVWCDCIRKQYGP